MHVVAANTHDETSEQLNGTTWRKKYNPNLTYFIGTKTMLGNKYSLFGNGYVPYNVLIGGGNRVTFSSTGMPSDADIAQAIMSLDIYADNPIADQVFLPSETKTIDLTNLFLSPHGTPAIQLLENSNPNKVTAVLNGTQLTLTAGSGFGFSTIKIKGSLGDYSAVEEFVVQIEDVNATIAVNEGFEATWPPTGWTNQGWQRSTVIFHSGTKSAGAIYTHTGNVHLTSPTLNIPNGGLLEFWWMDADITKIIDTDSTFCEVSSDGGVTWTNTATLSAASAQSVFSKVVVDLTPFAGTNTKVRFRDWSTGGSNAWGSGVDDIKITAYSNVGIEESNQVSKFSMLQNYPNPFNPSTTISFTLQNKSAVKLAVYNQAGEEVAVLAEGVLANGKHSINFDGSKLNSGVYFYSLQAGNQKQTGKMLLIK